MTTKQTSQQQSFRSMRIGIVMQSFRLGGLEELVYRLSDAYQQQGHEVQVIAFEKGSIQEKLERIGITTHYISSEEGFHPSLPKTLQKYFRQQKFDLVHTHHFRPLIYAAPAALLAKVPLVHTMHSNEHLVQSSRKHVWAYSLLINICEQITTVSEELGSFLRQEFAISENQLQVIRNGVDSEQFNGKHEVSQLHQELSLDKELPVLGTVARLDYEKGHCFLLDAMAQMKNKAQLILVGTGEEEEKLKRQADALGISERIHFLGLRHDIPTLLSLLDLFVLPSLREGLPLAVLEAMSSQKPVVATAVGGIPQLFAQSGGGKTVPKADPIALAMQIDQLLDDKETSKTMAQKGRTWIEKEYSQQAMVRQYLNSYQTACDNYHWLPYYQASARAMNRFTKQLMNLASKG